jgi:nitrite reductase/ring-hydroxylating ferredoxin subunit
VMEFSPRGLRQDVPRALREGASRAIEGNVLTCPWHSWRFDLETGAGLNQPARSVLAELRQQLSAVMEQFRQGTLA